MKRYAIIVAGGKGVRMGGEVPKQFLPVDGKPVLMRTLETFRRFDAEMQLVVVLPQDQITLWQELCRQQGCDIRHQVVAGGETRFHSVKNGLAIIPAENDAVVGVHDGVRPFVSQEVLKRCYDLAEEKKAVIPVIPVIETIRKINDAEVSETVPRSEYRLVQTPQVFNVALLKQAFQQPYTDAFTDDASVVEAMGTPVVLAEGNRENIKITTPFDLKIAEVLAK
jgi:2-C-methyl-D-erythritol 4-phosphate cytidylyltransferase